MSPGHRAGPRRCAGGAGDGGRRHREHAGFRGLHLCAPPPASRRAAAAEGRLGRGARRLRSEVRDYAIYEHCLPFNVARAYDEARGIDTPRIWTAERDAEMWAALQGSPR
jgi:hypothetical protein